MQEQGDPSHEPHSLSKVTVAQQSLEGVTHKVRHFLIAVQLKTFAVVKKSRLLQMQINYKTSILIKTPSSDKEDTWHKKTFHSHRPLKGAILSR